MSAPLKQWIEADGALMRLRLARPPANIIDAPMIAALESAFAGLATAPDVCAVLLDAQGAHFSFGASVEEHLPDKCAAMIKGLHALIGTMLDCPVPILVAIDGKCLGGGLEVACAGHLLFAGPDAALGQPEMKLGVFAPVASCLLPERMGSARAEDLLYSGRSISGREGLTSGLVNGMAVDPEAAALAYFDDHLASKSASSLRFAVTAARSDFNARVKAKIDVVEDLYLSQLMSTRDAKEGLVAFLEKRPPVWENK
jgi:cyclohexa-1,5-dienecarbonyl-CoA hydratase